jgi:hypothetical protein
LNQINLDRTHWFLRSSKKLLCLIPNPRPQYWWLDIVWIVSFACLQEIILPTLLPNWLHIDILTPWVVFNAITRRSRDTILLYILACLTLEGLSSVPAGFYFTVYALPIVVIPFIRSNLTWSFYTPWFFSFAGSLLWVHGFKIFVHLVISENYNISIYSVVFMVSSIALGTAVGSILSKPYQSTEFFVREGIA